MSSLRANLARAPRRIVAILALLAPALCLSSGCRSVSPLRVSPVPVQASLALEDARIWLRRGDPENRERARAAAEEAQRLAPSWVAPRRFLDDLLRGDLLGLEALAAHRRALETRANDAGETYLAGRLEGRQAGWRFELAVSLDPNLAWGYHGLAWSAAQIGDNRLALRWGERALERARDSWERSYFIASLARFHVASDHPKAALSLLLTRLNDPDTAPVDKVELEVQAAEIELSMVFQPESRRGVERAMELLRTEDLTDAEVDRLVKPLRLFRPTDISGGMGGAGSLDLQLALAARPSPARDRLRAELMSEYRPTPLALGLLTRAREREGRVPPTGPLMRAARFAAGQLTLGVEEWLADLPKVLVGSDGLPRDPALHAVVEAARGLSAAVPVTAGASRDAPESEVVALANFGELLVQAGWFREARAVAANLALHDLDRALALEDRAAAGQAFLVGMRQLMKTLEERGPSALSLTSGSSPQQGAERPTREVAQTSDAILRSLNDLLGAMAPLVARLHTVLGGETDTARVERRLRDSALLRFGFVGALVHPGPWFSDEDQAEGLGRAREPVPGLAEEFARIGRFAVFGEMLGGGGPDGTVLQRVLIERREDQHLGVKWSGTVAWCEGVDLDSRAGRLGASISGAALHEGYWVDIDSVRRDRDQWLELQREFAGGQNEERARLALSGRGLTLETPREHGLLRRAERRSIGSLLGEADRMRVAVLRDRMAALATAPSPEEAALAGKRPAAVSESSNLRAWNHALVGLDELVEITALHEEGHLCDRTRFLPLSRHFLRVLRFLFSVGFSPNAVAERLEYRAQLIAICESKDPRIACAEVLRACEGDIAVGITPHAGAYHMLLADLVGTLDRELERHPKDWPQIDPNYVLAHQFHWLGPEQVRKLALKLAKAQGLDEG
jgi:tetratricopeptide (TPR) repeat protein